MEQFQERLSNRAANASEVWVRNDSNGMTAIDAKASVRSITTPTLCAIILMSLVILIANVQPTQAQESSDIAKQAQNPIARLISVPVENDFNPQTGINKDDSYVLQFKPVVPFRLSQDWTLITRTIVPVIQIPDLAPGVNGTTGLGNVNLSLFLSPAKAGRIIWGVGRIVSFPTATENILGTKKLSVGPTVVALRSQGHWLYGMLVNNLFSVAGPSARPDVNQMLAQPFVNYNLRHGWYLTFSPIITANWQATRDPEVDGTSGRRRWKDGPFRTIACENVCPSFWKRCASGPHHKQVCSVPNAVPFPKEVKADFVRKT